MRIGLIGNPNCGKTTMFNAFTGSNQYVGNWPGVTVEKKEGKVKGYRNVILVDLPGIYSLSPYTPEEIVSRNFLIGDHVDAVINIVDGLHLERNLYLTSMLLEMGIPTVIALNMADVLEKRGIHINAAALEMELGVPVVETSASKGSGLDELMDRAIDIKGKNRKSLNIFCEKIEAAISKAETLISTKEGTARFAAIKALEQDERIGDICEITDEITLKQIIRDLEKLFDDDAVSIIASGRYDWIDDLIKRLNIKEPRKVDNVTEKIDKIVTDKYLAFPIFALIIWIIYFVSIQTVGNMTIGLMEGFFDWVGSLISSGLGALNVSPMLEGLIVDGLLGGVSAVLSFVPQIMILFLFISFLEDCGYMSRVAFIMDRLFKYFGLSGKSIIPMVIGAGCSVPGIMATRTIESEKDRRMTIILTPFIPCGAKLPVFALFAGALFRGNPFIGPSIYLLGFVMIIISGLLLKNTKAFKGGGEAFLMELPDYRMPKASSVLQHMWERGKEFIVRAGTLIFLACGIIWMLSSFSYRFEYVAPDMSMLANIGKAVAPVFRPLGFGNWQSAAALISGMVAKENVVATFGILFKLGEEMTETNPMLTSQIAAYFNAASAYSFMAFVLLAAPCFSAIGATVKEMGSVKWTVFALVFQTSVAYVVAFIIFQVGSMFIR